MTAVSRKKCLIGDERLPRESVHLRYHSFLQDSSFSSSQLTYPMYKGDGDGIQSIIGDAAYAIARQHDEVQNAGNTWRLSDREGGFAVLTLFVVFALLLFFAGPPLVKSYLTDNLSRTLGRKVSWEQCTSIRSPYRSPSTMSALRSRTGRSLIFEI